MLPIIPPAPGDHDFHLTVGPITTTPLPMAQEITLINDPLGVGVTSSSEKVTFSK